MKKVFYILSTLLIISAFQLSAQTQKGLDIDGESASDESGNSVSMPNAYTIAIGAYKNGVLNGHARIYEWSGSTWHQKGQDLDGTNNDNTGISVSMPDANTIAVGAHRNDQINFKSGQARIYQWKDSVWVQKGLSINGLSDSYLGYSIAMPDNNTVAVGAPCLLSNIGIGYIRIYKWNGIAWIQKGTNISGNNLADLFGYSISMPDSNTVAVGAPYDDNLNRNNAGLVRIYRWNGSAWIQKGIDLVGEAANNSFGASVSMPDSNIIAVGAPDNDGNGNKSGHVRIFKWNGSAWAQRGLDIDGESSNDFSGFSTSMPDTNTVAIGAYGNDTNRGHVRIYKWNGSIWVQRGIDIDGESNGDESGYSVSMPDTNTLGIGAPSNDGNGINSGQTRIYSFCDSATTSNISRSACHNYTSPSGNYNWDTSGTYRDIIYNSVGCDSIITINLTIQNTRETIAPIACINYFSPSGKYNWDTSGTYMDTIPNINSCDSIITIQLTVKAVDISTGRVSNSLISNAFGASYQWVNCDNNYAPISGDTNQIFTPTSTGNYAVIVTKNGCVDTSQCNFVVVVGLIENTFDDINIYPNPTNGKVTIDLGSNNLKVNLKVNNINGQLIQEKSNINTKQIALDLSNHPKGVYFITLQNETNIRVVKLVKN